MGSGYRVEVHPNIQQAKLFSGRQRVFAGPNEHVSLVCSVPGMLR